MAEVRRNGCQLYQEQLMGLIAPGGSVLGLFDPCPTCHIGGQVPISVSQHPHQPAPPPPPPGEPSSKRQRINSPGLSVADLQGMAKQRSLMICSPLSEVDLSNPAKVHTLTFPQFFSPLPIDRFTLDAKGSFVFMGREAFSTIYQTWLKAHNKQGLTEMNVYGTPGYGKSHILAALAIFLASLGIRVVYISDCYTLIKDPCRTLTKAFVSTFIDHPLYKDMALELESKKDLENFTRILIAGSDTVAPIQLTFIVDQANAFDPNPDVAESPQDMQEKGEAKQLLAHCSMDHILVRSASANNNTAKHFRHRQVSAVGEIILLNGGFTQAEVDAWWKANQPQLKSTVETQDDLNKLLYYTGKVPLFLFHYLSVVKNRRGQKLAEDFDSCWAEFVQFKLLRIISEQLRKATRMIINKKDTEPASFQDVRNFLIGCLAERDVPDVAPTEYDCRYFWRSDSVGRCLCGFVRDTMAMLLQELKYYADWMAPQYIFSAITGSNNPSVRGFLIEQACLSSLLNTSAEYIKDMPFRPSDIRYFDAGREADTFINDVFCVLYVPRPFNYKAVDAVLRILPAYAKQSEIGGDGAAIAKLKELQAIKTAIIIPVQITLSTVKKHEASVANFFNDRKKWLTHLVNSDGSVCQDPNVSWIFHWIVSQKEADTEEKKNYTEFEGQTVETRSHVKVIVPKHSLFIRSIEKITGKPEILKTPPASPSKQ